MVANDDDARASFDEAADFTSHASIRVPADRFPVGTCFRSTDSWLVIFGVVTKPPRSEAKGIAATGEHVHAHVWSKATGSSGERGPVAVEGLEKITAGELARVCEEWGWKRP